MNRVKWVFCVTLFLMMSLGMLYAQMAVGPNRPASVPSDYVITPFGYFHPSCVRQAKDGETVLADGRIRFADGTEETIAPFCSFPRYTAQGELVVEGSANPGPLDISWSWIESGQVVTSTTYDAVMAAWTVPQTPTSNDGQTLFFFPALTHNHLTPPNEEPIIQPVLGWNDGQSGAGPWNIASWNCCPAGMTWNSNPVTVSPGDQIQGTVMSACGGAIVQACSKWTITTGRDVHGVRDHVRGHDRQSDDDALRRDVPALRGVVLHDGQDNEGCLNLNPLPIYGEVRGQGLLPPDSSAKSGPEARYRLFAK